MILGGLQGHISAYPLCYNIDTAKERKTFPKEQKIKGSNRPLKGEITMKNANYTIDIMGNTITLTKAFYKKATSNIKNPEYAELKALMAEFPDYTIQLREIKKNPSKKTNRNLTYGNMKIYICENAENVKVDLAEFEKVKKTSCVFPSPYAYAKNWFINKYPAYENGIEQLNTQEETDTIMSVVGKEGKVA